MTVAVQTAERSLLNSSVLVLNKQFMALAVISVKRAFCMLVAGHAEVVAEEEEGVFANYNFESWRQISEVKQAMAPDEHEFVHTVNFGIIAPRIIRLPGYSRVPRNQVKLNRRNIFARDQNRCQYCGHKYSTSDLSIDHIVPRTQGGVTSWDNVVCACLDCNVRKGGRTPDQAGMHLISVPVRPQTSPIITQRLKDVRYTSWMAFLDHAYWSVELT
jgi:5-methylcytosine-specific restriction endonuclease McrA